MVYTVLKYIHFEFSTVSRSYVLALYVCIMCILFNIPDIEYRHGIDYRIICVHLPTSLLAYAILMRSVYCAMVYVLLGIGATNIMMHASGYVSVLSSISTGILWGWSQWGAIPWADSKVSFMFVLLLYYQTTMVLTYAGQLNSFYLSCYTLYVLYHVPVLKYNVFWFSEVHQRASIYLLDIYMSSCTAYMLIIYSCVFFMTVSCIKKPYI